MELPSGEIQTAASSAPMVGWAQLLVALGNPPSDVLNALQELGVPHHAARSAIAWAANSPDSATFEVEGVLHQAVEIDPDRNRIITHDGLDLPACMAQLHVAMAWHPYDMSAEKAGARSVRDAGFKGYVGESEDRREDRGEEIHPPRHEWDEDLYDKVAPEMNDDERKHADEHYGTPPDSYIERHDDAYDKAYGDKYEKAIRDDTPDHEDDHLHHFVAEHGGDSDLWRKHSPQPVNVDLSRGVYATQSHVGSFHVNRYLHGPAKSWHQQQHGLTHDPDDEFAYLGDGHPMFVSHQGRLHATEGHHRVAAALQRGDSHISGWHYDLDKAPIPTNDFGDSCEECQDLHDAEPHHAHTASNGGMINNVRSGQAWLGKAGPGTAGCGWAWQAGVGYGSFEETQTIHTGTYNSTDLGPENVAQTYEKRTPSSNSSNPVSTGWATSADPSGWIHPLLSSGFDASWEASLHYAEKIPDDAPTVSGVALKASDTGRALMIQRSLDDEKDPAAGTVEFPGGHHDEGDLTSLHAGIREFEEETGQPFPPGGHLTHVHRSGPYALHVVVIPSEEAVDFSKGRSVDNPDGDRHEQSMWIHPDDAAKMPNLRAELKKSSPFGEIKKAATLHDPDHPEPALPSTDSAAEEPEEPEPATSNEDPAELEVGADAPTSGATEWPTVAPGVDEMSRHRPWGYPEMPAAPDEEQQPAPGSSDVAMTPPDVSSGIFKNEAVWSPFEAEPSILAAFQQTAGFRALAADAPEPTTARGGPQSPARGTIEAPTDADIARAARAALVKMGAKTFSYQEQQELIGEGGGKVRARNYGSLDIANTHYSRIAEDDEPVDDDWALFL